MANKSDGIVSIHIEDNIDEAQKRIGLYEKKVNNFDISGLQGSINDLNKVIGGLSDKFADVIKPIDDDKKAFKELEIAYKTQSEEIEKLRKSHTELENSLKKQAQSVSSVKSVYSSLNKDINNNIEQLREIALAGGQNGETFKKLAAQTKEYKDMLEKADNAVKKATGDLEKQKNPIDGLTSKLKGLVGAYVGIRGAQMAFNSVMQSVEAYRVQERAVLSLDTTLKNAGVYTAEYSQKIQNLASEIQGYSNYGDEAVIKAVALGQSFAGQTKITDKATKAVVDFAAATGMDLEQAFSLFGKSVGTSTNALSRYGVELKKGMTDQQKMEAITKQLGERYEGQAAKMSDANVQLKNSIGDMKEAFGGIFNSYVTNWQRGMSKMVQSTTDFINSIRIMNAETSTLTLTELDKRYNENLKKIAYHEKSKNKIHLIRVADLKAENNLLLDQIEYIKKRNSNLLKPIKTKDDDETGGGNGKTTQKIKDQYEKLTEEVQKAEKALKAALTVSGGNITPEVQKINDKLKESQSVVKQVEDAYKNLTSTATNAVSGYQQLQDKVAEAHRKVLELASADVVNLEALRLAKEEWQQYNDKLTAVNEVIKNSAGPYQELTEKVSELKKELYDMITKKQTNTELFANLKAEYEAGMQELENVNKTFQQNFEQGFKGISSSIYSSLSNAILTPLAEGETAIQRLGNIGLNITKQIADTAIQALLKEITLEKTKNAIKAAGSFFSSGGGFLSKLFKNAQGNVFENGDIKAFASGGVVSQPTYFPMAGGKTGLMGEAGAEAVMPLKRTKNGDLGVQAQPVQPNINIYNYSDSRIETVKRPNGDTDIFIKRFNAALSSERTQQGFSSALQRNNSRGIQAS